MATPTDPDSKARAGLDRERLLVVAVGLADHAGIAALSMRKLGRALRVEAMSLYNHIANRDDLLDGMVDLVFGEISLPPSGEEWKSALRVWGLSAREVLSHHPWAIGLVASWSRPSPATLRHYDAVIRCLREAGFSIVMAEHAIAVLNSYVFGFALLEASLLLKSLEEVVEVTEGSLRPLPFDAYSHMTEMSIHRMAPPGHDRVDEFTFGLELVLDGLARIREVAQ
jgi:AcrR family transcriptional regulator